MAVSRRGRFLVCTSASRWLDGFRFGYDIVTRSDKECVGFAIGAIEFFNAAIAGISYGPKTH